ncbi:MAG: hypothetical protein ACE5EV_06150, partial [Gaiellales bacterium]
MTISIASLARSRVYATLAATAALAGGAPALAPRADAAAAGPKVTFLDQRVQVITGRTADVRIACPGSAGACKGTLTLKELPTAKARTSARAAGRKAKVRRYARARFAAVAGAPETVTVELRKGKFKRLARKGPITLRAIAKVRDRAGRRRSSRAWIEFAVPRRAPRELFVGVADDSLTGDAPAARQAISDLGLQAVRLVLEWKRGQTALDESQVAALDKALSYGEGLRFVIAARSENGTSAPTSPEHRAQYCSFLGDLVSRYPSVRDVAVWLEPNKQRFW